MFLKNIWNHLHAFHVMKNLLKIDSAEEFLVFQKFCFSESQSIESIFWSIEKVKFSKLDLLPSSINVQSMLDWSKLENFQFLNFLPIFFFHASFMFRIHMHCIVFCIHLAFLQSYVSSFSYVTCIHFAKLDTQLDLKIDWLIFESFVYFSICYLDRKSVV